MAEEKIYKGIPASNGISFGKAYLYTRKQIKINFEKLGDEEIKEEIEEFKKAIEYSRKELLKIYNIAVEKIGEKNSKIFEAQLEILNDSIFFEKVTSRIRYEKRAASYVFNDEIDKLGQILLAADDDYMKERFADINDVKNRVVRNMKREKLVSKIVENMIVVAHELTPGDTILFSRRKVMGYCTDTGGFTSHAAIISRALRIPAVVGMKLISSNIKDGENIIIDGFEGLIITNPTEETIERYENKIRLVREQEEKLLGIKNLPAITIDGKVIEVNLNIDFDEELQFIEEYENSGIGLYRTEHLFIEKGGFPTEEEQIEEYETISKLAYPRSVTIRTFDIGGDKILPSSEKEDNPFLGWRGIRISLDREDMFKEQLRAMLIASKNKNVKIMLPMISSLEEVKKAKEIFNETKLELSQQGIEYDPKIQLGIMIETPSACILADELAKESAFFSLGTNDLIQYTLAVDRGNEMVADMYSEFHPAVLRLIKLAVDAAHRNNIKISICGEMASQPLNSIVLVGLGVDELSVNPAFYAEIIEFIRNIKYSDAKELVDKILSLSTAKEVSESVNSFYNSEIKPYLN